MIIKTFQGGYDNNFTYIIHNDNNCCIIDPAISSEKVLGYIKERNLLP